MPGGGGRRELWERNTQMNSQLTKVPLRETQRQRQIETEMVVVNYCGSQHCDGHSTVSYCRSFGSGVQGSFCFLLPLGFVWFGGACAVCGVCVCRYYT